MKTLCKECGYHSNLQYEGGICPNCKHDNSVNDYQKGDKFKVNIEGSEHFFRYVDDVIDHVQCNTCFEVDSDALRVDLKYLNKNEIIELRYDCIVKRIA
jgi:predicted ATP-dependent serine protease